MITIPGSGRTDRKPGQARVRIRYAAGPASRSVSSWMPTAIFVAVARCLAETMGGTVERELIYQRRVVAWRVVMTELGYKLA